MDEEQEPEEGRLAVALGAPASLGVSMTRALREASPPLWIRKGRGHRFVRPQRTHGTNLTLAVVGDPVDGQRRPVTSPMYVVAWRSLRFREFRRVETIFEQGEPGQFVTTVRRSTAQKIEDLADDDPAKSLLGAGEDFGTTMDRLPAWMALAARQIGASPRNAPAGMFDAISVELQHGANPSATIRCTPPVGSGFIADFITPPEQWRPPSEGLKRITIIPPQVLTILAEMDADDGLSDEAPSVPGQTARPGKAKAVEGATSTARYCGQPAQRQPDTSAKNAPEYMLPKSRRAIPDAGELTDPHHHTGDRNVSRPGCGYAAA